MDCRDIDFSPTKSEQRIQNALDVIPRALLMRLMAFVLHLLGAERNAVAALLGMPAESVKTVVRQVMGDGFEAIRDRRRTAPPRGARSRSKPEPEPFRIAAARQGDLCLVQLGPTAQLQIPLAFRVQARTVLLSLINAGLLSVEQGADALEIHPAHCRELASKLAEEDVPESLVDKRQGQKRDYVVTAEVKAAIIEQLTARCITGQSTSSEVLAEQVSQSTQTRVSARTVRYHVQKLGLTRIRQSLPKLVEALKKRS